MVVIKPSNKSSNKSCVTIDCEQKETNDSNYYNDLISPAAVLNEKEVCNSLGFFSTKAPKKKFNLKKIASDDLKSKRKRLENYFSTIDLDGWSDHNFIYQNNKSEDWHDDLHYIVLKQQERSKFIHQLWLFLMLALLCIVLISIAGVIYTKNGLHKNADQIASYEFIQKFIDDFNRTESPKHQPDPLNRYKINSKIGDESNESWLRRKAKYLSTLLGEKENEALNLTKKAADKIRSFRLYEGTEELKSINNHANLNQVDYELFADESSPVGRLSDQVEKSIKSLVDEVDYKSFLNKIKSLF